MADALTYIATRWNLTLSQRRMPLEIPNADRVTLAHLFHVLEFHTGAEIGVRIAVAKRRPSPRMVERTSHRKYSAAQ